MKTKSSVKRWLSATVLALFVLAGAISLRHLTVANTGSVLVANGGAPVPPIPPGSCRYRAQLEQIAAQ